MVDSATAATITALAANTGPATKASSLFSMGMTTKVLIGVGVVGLGIILYRKMRKPKLVEAGQLSPDSPQMIWKRSREAMAVY